MRRAGISLAMVAKAYGCRCFIALPDDAAAEKAQLLTALGEPADQSCGKTFSICMLSDSNLALMSEQSCSALCLARDP